jgi:tetratricopeptide (TPR) repeat protein
MRIRQPVVLSLVALLAACASQQTFTVRVMKPAPVDLGRYRLVAVDRLDGDGADQLTHELSKALQGAQNPLTGKADFEVLDRAEIDRLLEDLRRRRAGATDQQTLELLERWKNAEVVIRGQIRTHKVSDEVVAQDWIDRTNGHRHVQFVRTCRARVAVNLEVVTANQERPIDQVQLDECVTRSVSALDVEPPAIEHGPLLASARQRVVQGYMDRLLPHEESVGVCLQTDGDLPELAAGNGFAMTGDWDEAARSYEAAAARAQGGLASARWKALYNLGVAQLYANRFEPARKSLKEAYSLAQEDVILGALQSVTQREREWQALQEQSRAGAGSPAK